MKADFDSSYNLESLDGGHSRGFSVLTATVFIVGEVAGGGILSLAHATSQAGWSGIALIVYCCICAGISGLYLAECWVILEERYPEYRKELTRKPFATIGYHAYGNWMSAFVSFLINVTNMGATVVFILLSSGMISSLLSSWNLGLCNWALIICAALLIPMWLGSPADFWPVAYTAMLSTVVGTILLVVMICIEIVNNGFSDKFEFRGVEEFSTAFGTILFAFGGAPAFPNFQNDMKDKRKFPTAVIFGFIGLLILYIPVAGLGYAAFGINVENNIIENIDRSIVITIIEVCFLIHCFTVALIVINPVFLDIEELLQIPKPFTWKRAVFRTAILLVLAFLAQTFPKFGQILNLIGGSTVTIMAFILPPILFMKLSWDKKVEWPDRSISVTTYIVIAIIMATGIVGGIASTYSTISQWTALDSACYLR